MSAELYCEICNKQIALKADDWENEFDGKINYSLCIACYEKRNPKVIMQACPNCKGAFPELITCKLCTEHEHRRCAFCMEAHNRVFHVSVNAGKWIRGDQA